MQCHLLSAVLLLVFVELGPSTNADVAGCYMCSAVPCGTYPTGSLTCTAFSSYCNTFYDTVANNWTPQCTVNCLPTSAGSKPQTCCNVANCNSSPVLAAAFACYTCASAAECLLTSGGLGTSSRAICKACKTNTTVDGNVQAKTCVAWLPGDEGGTGVDPSLGGCVISSTVACCSGTNCNSLAATAPTTLATTAVATSTRAAATAMTTSTRAGTTPSGSAGPLGKMVVWTRIITLSIALLLAM